MVAVAAAVGVGAGKISEEELQITSDAQSPSCSSLQQTEQDRLHTCVFFGSATHAEPREYVAVV